MHSRRSGVALVASAPLWRSVLMAGSRRRWLVLGGLVVVLVLGVATVLIERAGGSAAPAGVLLPTPASVAHGQDVALVSCRRGVDGFADVELTMSNPMPSAAAEFGVAVSLTSPTSGRSYDTVLAKYTLAPNQSLRVEAFGMVPVPASLACQVSQVNLDRGA